MLTAGAADHRILGSLGYAVPMTERIETARQLIEMSHASTELYKRAFDLADRTRQPLAIAQIDLSYSRFLTFSVINIIWQTGDLDAQARVSGEAAISHALRAADTYAKHGVLRNMVIGLNEAAVAAGALNDRARLEEYSSQASAIAEEYGYLDLVTSAGNLRSGPTVLKYYRQAKSPAPFHRQDPADRERFIDELIRLTRLDPDGAARVRSVMQRELAALAHLDAKREEICKYLALLQDLLGPKIGPFNAVDPDWNVICRMRGLSSVRHHRRAKPLLDQFVAGVCCNCEFRAPGAAPPETDNSDEVIYAPLFERIAEEG
jgi:hypothetical protein